MLSHEFIRLALLAGTPIALACGLVGYMVVLRSEVFAGDALSHVAFTGALAAAAAGIDLRAGLFAATVAVAAGMGLLGPRAHADDVVIGTVFAWILGLGALSLSLFVSGRSSGNGAGGVHVLFGSIFGLGTGQAQLAALIAVGVIAALIAIARPLLFASLDGAVAEARGLPVRGLGVLFLCLLGLLAAPAGAAHRLTVNPYRGLALSGALAVGALWLGIALAYSVPSFPPSSAIITVAAAAYLASGAATRLRRREVSRLAGPTDP